MLMIYVNIRRLYIYLLLVSLLLDVGKNLVFCEINIKVLFVYVYIYLYRGS